MTHRGSPVRLGIIGARGQGGFYADLIAAGRVADMTVGALTGRGAATAASARERHGGVPFFTDPIEMMDSGAVDAIVTTVPHYLHPEMAIAGMQRGLHVLVEKPLGVYTKQVGRMLEVAAATPSVVLAAMFNQRANPVFARLREVIATGEIGELRRITWVITNWFRPQSYYDASPWRGTWGGEGGGVLVNQAAHQIDLFQWLFGTPRSVFARVPFGFAHDFDVDDDVTAVLDYGRRGTGVLITATHDMLGSDRLEVQGDRGRIILEDSQRATITRLNRPMDELSATLDAGTIQRIVRGTMDWSEFSTTEILAGSTGYGEDHVRVLENFAHAILHGEPLVAPAAEGPNAVRLANAIILSGWLGCEVPFDFDEDLFLAELNVRIRAEGGYPERS